MKLTAIPIDGYYLIVSDEDVTTGCPVVISNMDDKMVSKIIAVEPKAPDKYPGLPLFDAPSEWGEESNMTLSAQQYALGKSKDKVGCLTAMFLAWKEGYNAAKEKYKFTREDMEKCWEAAKDHCLDISDFPMALMDHEFDKNVNGKQSPNMNDFLQSLQKPKVYEVTIEYDIEKLRCENWCADCKAFDWGMCKNKYQPKLTNNKITILSWKEIN